MPFKPTLLAALLLASCSVQAASDWAEWCAAGLQGKSHIRRVTLAEFDNLPIGTVLVETSTRQRYIVGVDFFDLTVMDAKGRLDYGFSARQPKEPFAAENWKIPFIHTLKGAVALNSRELHRLDLPLAAKDYLRLEGLEWEQEGSKLTIRIDTPEYGSVVLTLGSPSAEGITVQEIVLYSPKTKLQPAVDRVRLVSREQIKDFFAKRIQERGGMRKLIEAYRERTYTRDSWLKSALGSFAFEEVLNFRTPVR